MADAGLDRSGQLVDGFVVAVQRDPLGRKVGVQRDGEFAAAADVQRQAFLVDPAGDLGAQERLGRVSDVLAAAERVGDLAAARPEVVLVDDENGRAVLVGDIGDLHPGDRHHAVVVANGVARPHIRREQREAGPTTADAAGRRRGEFPRRAADRRDGRSHPLRCGDARESPRPFPMTWRVAWHSASRAACSSVGFRRPAAAPGRSRRTGDSRPPGLPGSAQPGAAHAARPRFPARAGTRRCCGSASPSFSWVSSSRWEVSAMRPSSAALRASAERRACAYCT